MQMYLINSYAQLALVDRRFRRRKLDVTATLNVFLWTVGQSISLRDSPIIVTFCIDLHYMHFLTFTKGISIWFLKCFKKNAFDIRILRKIYLQV